MSQDRNLFEIFVGEPSGRKNHVVIVPILSTVPSSRWPYDEGACRWVIAGVPLIDQDFALYPENQMIAVVTLLEAALKRVPLETSLPGSIIRLRTEPIDPHHARFVYELPDRSRTKIVERREVVGNIRKVASSVLEAVETIQTHLRSVKVARMLEDDTGQIERCKQMFALLGQKHPPKRHSTGGNG